MTQMMKCGHAANAVSGDKPVCAICFPDPRAHTPVEDFELSNRKARCACGRIVPSSIKLAFFEYTGEGSSAAIETCATCHYFETAHSPDARPNVHICDNFKPHGPYEYDRYYCGCRGWD